MHVALRVFPAGSVAADGGPGKAKGNCKITSNSNSNSNSKKSRATATAITEAKTEEASCDASYELAWSIKTSFVIPAYAGIHGRIRDDG
jgi:hypothetical protein